MVKEIESHKEEFEKEYLKYRLAKSSEERELELDEIRDRIKDLLEKTGRENTKLLSAALFQSSLKGRNSYLKKLLSEAHVIEKAVNKKNQADT